MVTPYKERIVLSHSFDIVRDITGAGPHALYATPFVTPAFVCTHLPHIQTDQAYNSLSANNLANQATPD